MKGKYLTAFMALLMVTGASTAIATNNTKQVTVTNNTTYSLTEFYVSPSDSSADWNTDNNLLGGQIIAPGNSLTVTIADGLDECTYDLMGVLYGVAEHAYQYQINTCNGNSANWNVTQ